MKIAAAESKTVRVSSVAPLAAAAILLCIAAGPLNHPVRGDMTGTGSLPQIIAFQVSPAEIASGGSAVLSWKTEDAAAVSIDQNVGDVAPEGQLTVTPAYSTTYKLTVSNDAGVRTRYLTLQVSRVTPGATGTVSVDPVTGRNSSLDLSWEDYCYSSDYQVQIARDEAFTLKVYDSGILQPADSVFPAFSYPPGRLEAGHTYYWRVRTVRSATGQWAVSPWSEAKPITVEPGFPVRADYYGVQALSPVNTTGQAGAAASPSIPGQALNTTAAPADAPPWAIVIIIVGSLLTGMLVAVTIRQGKKV